jgi:hypothetical protein
VLAFCEFDLFVFTVTSFITILFIFAQEVSKNAKGSIVKFCNSEKHFQLFIISLYQYGQVS